MKIIQWNIILKEIPLICQNCGFNSENDDLIWFSFQT